VTLPDVTIVFASVAESLSFTSKQSRATVRSVNASIVKVMLQQMEHIPGNDGYLCRWVLVDASLAFTALKSDDTRDCCCSNN
jgi:ribosomal silencing factor RsfS